MNHLVRLANLQIVALILQILLAFRAGGTALGSSSLVLLDLVIWPLAIWLSSAGREATAPVKFWGPWPWRWVPATFLGWVLGALNLAAFLRLVLRSFPWTGDQAHVRFYALQYAALALLFFWAAFRAHSGQPGRTASGLPAPALREGGPAWLHAVREAAAQEERNRLARDLHDSIKQQLFTIQIGAATVRERWDRDPEGARTALDQVERGARAAMVEARALLQQLRPQALSGGGLVEALREQCEALELRTGARVKLELGEPVPDDRLPVEATEALFRMAQEALSNVARHARPQEVTVFLGRREDRFALEIRDDGKGFDPAAESAGRGLHNLRERAARLEADLRVTSRPGEGTAIAVGIPLAAEEAAAGPTPEPAWLRKLPYRHLVWREWVMLFFGLLFISGIGGPEEKEPLSWGWVLFSYTWVLGMWAYLLACSAWGMRKLKALRVPLAPRMQENLYAAGFRYVLIFDVFLLLGLAHHSILPPRPSPYALGALLSLALLGKLVAGLILFHRRSEPGGWLYSLLNLLRGNRRGELLLWVGFAVVVALPVSSGFRSFSTLLEPEALKWLGLWVLLILYLGLRVPRGAFLSSDRRSLPKAASAPAASPSIVAGR